MTDYDNDDDGGLPFDFVSDVPSEPVQEPHSSQSPETATHAHSDSLLPSALHHHGGKGGSSRHVTFVDEVRDEPLFTVAADVSVLASSITSEPASQEEGIFFSDNGKQVVEPLAAGAAADNDDEDDLPFSFAADVPAADAPAAADELPFSFTADSAPATQPVEPPAPSDDDELPFSFTAEPQVSASPPPSSQLQPHAEPRRIAWQYSENLPVAQDSASDDEELPFSFASDPAAEQEVSSQPMPVEEDLPFSFASESAPPTAAVELAQQPAEEELPFSFSSPSQPSAEDHLSMPPQQPAEKAVPAPSHQSSEEELPFTFSAPSQQPAEEELPFTFSTPSPQPAEEEALSVPPQPQQPAEEQSPQQSAVEEELPFTFTEQEAEPEPEPESEAVPATNSKVVVDEEGGVWDWSNALPFPDYRRKQGLAGLVPGMEAPAAQQTNDQFHATAGFSVQPTAVVAHDDEAEEEAVLESPRFLPQPGVWYGAANEAAASTDVDESLFSWDWTRAQPIPRIVRRSKAQQELSLSQSVPDIRPKSRPPPKRHVGPSPYIAPPAGWPTVVPIGDTKPARRSSDTPPPPTMRLGPTNHQQSLTFFSRK